MGKTYYDRFIKPGENARLKHFISEGMDALDRGFIPIPIEAIEDPSKAIKSQNKGLLQTVKESRNQRNTAHSFNARADSRKIASRYSKGRNNNAFNQTTEYGRD